MRCVHNDCPNEATHWIRLQFKEMEVPYSDGITVRHYVCKHCISRTGMVRCPIHSRSRRYMFNVVAVHFLIGYKWAIGVGILSIFGIAWLI